MRLTPFGEAVRLLRMRLDISLKSMAEAMGISSAHLSGIEYGEKRLSDKHIQQAIDYFHSLSVDEKDIDNLQSAAEKSKATIDTSALTPDERGLVAAFARRLQDGGAPTKEIEAWLNGRKAKGKGKE